MTKDYPEYYEDFEAGMSDEFGGYKVTREEIIEFATKYDPQPFHLSDEAAANSIFGKLAASGWHTCAMTMRMIVDQLEVSGTKSLGGGGIDKLRWRHPVYVDDILRVKTTIGEKALHPNKPMGFIDMEHEILNQDDIVVMSYTARIIMALRGK
jgi:acyl dehydratase